MSQRYVRLIIILLMLAVIIWIDLPDNPGIHVGDFNRNLDTVLGLDLRGGMQVLLEVDLPEETPVEPQSLHDARLILENRSNGLGVSEVVFQVAGNRRIVGEFPGLTNTEEVIGVLKETGLLEFVDLGFSPLEPGTVIYTDYSQSDSSIVDNIDESAPEEEQIYPTVMTGSQLKNVSVGTDRLGKYLIQFELEPQGAVTFSDYTENNVGSYLAIVLDNIVISSPKVESHIPDGQGIITGNFTYDTANNLAIQLRYGSLPIPWRLLKAE